MRCGSHFAGRLKIPFIFFHFFITLFCTLCAADYSATLRSEYYGRAQHQVKQAQLFGLASKPVSEVAENTGPEFASGAGVLARTWTA